MTRLFNGGRVVLKPTYRLVNMLPWALSAGLTTTPVQSNYGLCGMSSLIVGSPNRSNLRPQCAVAVKPHEEFFAKLFADFAKRPTFAVENHL